MAIVSGTEALVIDASASPRSAARIVDSLAAWGVERLRGVVHTHGDQDHLWGSQAFLARFPSASVIAHTSTHAHVRDVEAPNLAVQIERIRTLLEERDGLLERGENAEGEPLSSDERDALAQRQTLFRALVAGLEEVRPVLPTLRFDDVLHLTVRTLEVELRHVGPAHAPGDVIALVPERGVAVAGDVVTEPFPAAGVGYSSVVGWSLALDALAATGAGVVVAGHGGVLRDGAYVEALRRLLGSIEDAARVTRAAGEDMEAVLARLDVSDFVETWVPGEARGEAAFRRFFLEPAAAIALEEVGSRK